VNADTVPILASGKQRPAWTVPVSRLQSVAICQTARYSLRVGHRRRKAAQKRHQAWAKIHGISVSDVYDSKVFMNRRRGRRSLVNQHLSGTMQTISVNSLSTAAR